VSGGGGHVEVQVLPHANEKEAVTATLMRHLAGRAAEDVLLGSVSGGAGGSDTSDLANATRAAISEALSLGRGGDLIWHPVDEPPAVLFARHPGLKDCVLKRVKGAYAGARALIRNNRKAVEMIASHLVVDGHLDQADLRDLLLFCRTAPHRDDGAQGGDMFGLKS
jgi:ATP-dependent Zn protease